MPERKIILTVFFLFFTLLTAATAQSGRKYLCRIGEIHTIHSTVLDEDREVFIQVPEDYDPEGTRKYPVACILDGEKLLPAMYVVQEYYSGGFLPEMILVGISNRKNRTRDLTPTIVKTRYGMPFNGESGGADEFLRFLEDELLPYVADHFRVTEYRTLIGHSYGGLFVIHTLFNRPQMFANYLAIDPSLDWDDQALLKQTGEILSTKDLHGRALYQSLSGQLHMADPAVTIDNVMQDTSSFTLFARSNLAFSDLVRQNETCGLSFSWEFFPHDLHGTVPLPSIRNGLISLFEWFQMENTEKFNSPETSKEELYKLVTYRAEKLKSHFGYDVAPYPEELLNVLGYMSLDVEQTEKARMYFELCMKFYPDSPGACDSMADFYAAQGDYENAVKYVNRAYELSGNDQYIRRIQELKNEFKQSDSNQKMQQ